MPKVDELKLRRKLRDDFEFYAKHCLTIRTKEGDLSRLVLNSAQRIAHEKMTKQMRETGRIRAIILKGRQQGMSTYVEARFVWRTTHSVGLRAFILTHEEFATNNLFEMTRRYYEHLPPFVKPKTGVATAKEMNFAALDSGFKIGTAGNKAVGRSGTVQLFHGSEVAYWPNAAEHTRGIMQSVPDMPGTELILESTADGIGTYFHTQWEKAVRGESEFIAIFVPWYVQSEYRKTPPAGFVRTAEEEELARRFDLDDAQLYWRRIKIVEFTTSKQDGEIAFNQEYPNTANEAFQFAVGETLIKSSDVVAARQTIVQGSGPLVVGVDPSRGGDRFATIKRHGRKMYEPQAYEGKQVKTLGQKVAICKRLLDEVCPVAGKKPDMMFIDYAEGGDLVDRLHELGYKDRVKSIHFAAAPLNPQRYSNKRNEMWGEMAEWFTDENLPVDVEDSDPLQADLTASPYKRDSHDRKCLLSKDDIKKDLGFSPDFGDAAALTFAEPVTVINREALIPKPRPVYTSGRRK